MYLRGFRRSKNQPIGTQDIRLLTHKVCRTLKWKINGTSSSLKKTNLFTVWHLTPSQILNVFCNKIDSDSDMLKTLGRSDAGKNEPTSKIVSTRRQCVSVVSRVKGHDLCMYMRLLVFGTNSPLMENKLCRVIY